MASDYIIAVLEQAGLTRLHEKTLVQRRDHVHFVELYLNREISHELYEQRVSRQHKDLKECSKGEIYSNTVRF